MAACLCCLFSDAVSVLRKIHESKRDEVTGEWGRLHHEELDDPYSLPNVIWVIRSRRVR